MLACGGGAREGRPGSAPTSRCVFPGCDAASEPVSPGLSPFFRSPRGVLAPDVTNAGLLAWWRAASEREAPAVASRRTPSVFGVRLPRARRAFRPAPARRCGLARVALPCRGAFPPGRASRFRDSPRLGVIGVVGTVAGFAGGSREQMTSSIVPVQSRPDDHRRIIWRWARRRSFSPGRS